jgi:hypothetical protein
VTPAALEEDIMKYALLGYDTEGALEALAADDKRALHGGHHALHDEHEAASGSVTVIAHYRFRPPRLAATVRLVGGETVTTEGPLAESSASLRALYLLESDDRDAVLDFARQLPALRMGGTIEVWAVTEPHRG